MPTPTPGHLEQLAHEEFTCRNPYPGDGLPNHCRRLRALALLLGRRHGVAADEDLIGAGIWLHDIGLLVEDPAEPNYLKRGLSHCQALMDAWGLDGGRRDELRQMLLYNHSLGRVPGILPQAELLCRAVHVEHSHGLLREGLARPEVRQVFRDFPWDNFNRVLVDFARIALVKDGAGTLLPIFFPRA